ncbi:hypothetical protein [Vibrio campbellii]|uniref:hypothetical protein n=1 Tax=Vibrio campbellii TaxID=680 RepID=UPI0005EE9A60|nr:hypothetical protein [Vibrio campbellii]HDM8209856.1 hypothetical protein [Vibrio campbellii]
MKVVFICLFFLLAGCEPVDTIEKRDRPSLVPLSAHWVGGLDGGVYLEVYAVGDNYTGTVYYQNSGEVWYQGGFKYSGKGSIDVNNGKLFSSWDGDTIYLTTGEKLTIKSD